METGTFWRHIRQSIMSLSTGAAVVYSVIDDGGALIKLYNP